MSTADRRMEIISILVVSGHVTSRELAQEFGDCVRTIRNDITALSYGYNPPFCERHQWGYETH
ncbi:MAG: DeoR family transcriptional regulator, partial [Lachnospiraceae bacterium]|nr:DeoR family transcriptional regulator [Lachnospiraceae bacterium]